MPTCPLHVGEELEPKRKGWFCEECGAIVFGYDRFPRPKGLVATDDEPPPSLPPMRPVAYSLPCAASDGTPTTPLVSPEPALLTRDEATRWALVAPAARAARQTLRSLAAFGLPASLYVERHGIDDVLRECLARSRRAVLVVGDPGVGKTALLSRLVESLIASDESSRKPQSGEASEEVGTKPTQERAADTRDVVMFLAGRAAFQVDDAVGPEHRLCEAVLRCADLQPAAFESLSDFAASVAETERSDAHAQRKVWIVLDGIDQADDVEQLVAQLDAFLPDLGTYPWLRLIVSMRRTTYAALESGGAPHHREGGAFAQARWLAWFHDDATQRPIPYLDVRRFHEASEGRAAYDMRQARMPHRAVKIGYRELSPAIRAMITVPLYLHLFHDAFRGGKAPPLGLDEPSLVDAYLDALVDAAPGLDATLPKLGEALLRLRRPGLPLDVAEVWRAEWAEARAKREGVGPALDPVAELVTATGLMGPEEVGYGPDRGQIAWRFGHTRIAEQVLLRELLAQIAPRTVPTGDEVLAWARTAAGGEGMPSFAALVGALEVLVTRLVSRGEAAFVVSLLDIEHDSTRARLLGAALRALGPAWGQDDEPSPGAARMLEIVGNAGLRSGRGKRLIADAWEPLRWLMRHGYAAAASAFHHRLFNVARAVFLDRDTEGRLALASTLNALGELARARGDIAGAREVFAAALDQLSEAADAKDAGDAVRTEVALSHRKLAELAVADGDDGAARQALESALRIASKTDDEGQAVPPGQHVELLLGLLALGAVLLRQGALREAEPAYEEALRASIAAIAEAPHRLDMRRCKAEALRGLAEIAAETNHDSRARERLGGALRVLRKVCRREPQRWDFQRLLVQTLQRQADLCRTAASDYDACQLLEEAAAIMLALVHTWPEYTNWRFELVRLLSNLGVLMRQIGEDEPARACLEDAVRHGRILRDLVQDDHDVREHMASALMSLVQLDESEGRRYEARKHVREAIDNLRSLLREGPDRRDRRRALASSLFAMGRLASDDGDGEGAEANLKEAVRHLSEMVSSSADDIGLQSELGAVINGLRSLGGGGRVRRIPEHRFSVIVSEKGAAQVREYYDKDEISIGRAPGNDLMLPNYSVSRHHATVQFKAGMFTIEDNGSKHGTSVNGKKVDEPIPFRPGDRVDLGDFALVFEGKVDTSYGAQWSSMMANAPTGFPYAQDETAPLPLAALAKEIEAERQTGEPPEPIESIPPDELLDEPTDAGKES